MKLKYHKGFNGQHRKARRILAQMEAMWMNGTTFNELWAVFQPLDIMRCRIPANDLAQYPIEKALNILHGQVPHDYEDEVVAEYWANK